MKLYRIFSPLGAALCFFILVSLPLCVYGLSLRDEGLLWFYAWQIQLGKIPYKDFFMVLSPGSYYVQAFVGAVFGNYIITGRILYIVFACGILLLVSLLFPLKRVSMYFVLCTLAVLYLSPGAYALYTQETTFVLLLTAYFIDKAVRKKNAPLLFLAGMSAGSILFFKQSIGLTTIPPLAFFVYGMSEKKKLKNLLTFGSGVITFLILYLLYFAYHGALLQFLYYQFVFSSKVKSYQESFILHRVIAVPIIITGFSFFLLFSKKAKGMLLFLATVLCLGYIASSPARLHRLGDYFLDPLFYFSGISFVLPLFALGFYVKTLFQKKLFLIKRIDRFVIGISTLLVFLFLGLSSSGFNGDIFLYSAPFSIPLLFLLRDYKIPQSKKFFYNILLFVVVFAIAVTSLYSHVLPASKVYGVFPLNTLYSHMNLKPAWGIRVTKDEARDIPATVFYITKHTKPTDKIMCFPYCPFLLFLSQRTNASFFNFFYRELFMQENQKTVISELSEKPPALLVLQKKGSIEKEAEFENRRLSKLISYFNSHYKKVYENQNFVILKKR